jgi:quercetin dioxygenase-like cupin family protein
MRFRNGLDSVLVAFACVGAAGACLAVTRPRAAAVDHKERDRIVISQALPALDGTHLKATLVEVDYGSGGSSGAHSHPCPVIGYVISGALRTQVKGEPEAIYKASETFYEAPNGVHAVSANASQTEPVKFLAYFVCDRDVPLSTDTPNAGSAEKNQ